MQRFYKIKLLGAMQIDYLPVLIKSLNNQPIFKYTQHLCLSGARRSCAFF